MITMTSKATLKYLLDSERARGASIGLVPTMGALHRGHAALVEESIAENSVTLVTIFVNRGQFFPDGYLAYPRSLEADQDLLGELKVDYLFAPPEMEIYPNGFDTAVEPLEIVDRLDGSSIRWSYRAMATIVAKLFNIVRPDRAYFGAKDPHQLAIIRRMSADLDFDIDIKAVDIIRDSDGLASSSRAVALDEKARRAASIIPRAIARISASISSGERDFDRIALDAREFIESEPLARAETVEIVDHLTLKKEITSTRALIYLVVSIDGSRLTDNQVVDL